MSIYDRFLDYLRVCGGCSGPIREVDCGFKVTCATAEALAKKGIVRSAAELRKYGEIERSNQNG